MELEFVSITSIKQPNGNIVLYAITKQGVVYRYNVDAWNAQWEIDAKIAGDS